MNKSFSGGGHPGWRERKVQVARIDAVWVGLGLERRESPDV